MSTAEQYEEDLDAFLEHEEEPEGYRAWAEAERLASTTLHPTGVPGVFTQGGHAPAYKLPDDGAADWAFGHLSRTRERLSEVKQLMIARQKRLTEWNETVTRPLRQEEAHWEALLDEYALRRRQETGAASVKLPNGTLATTLRDKGGAVEIHDPMALHVFLMARPDLEKRWCKIEPEPQVTRFKDDITIEKGAICVNCGKLLRYGQLQDQGSFWLAPGNVPICLPPGTAPDPNVPGHGHSPKCVDEDGELEVRQVPVWVSPVHGPMIVPGLTVRAEHVTATAKPA